MNTGNPMNDEILTQAGEWLLELQSPEVSVERLAAWQEWLARSEQHLRAFGELQQTWRCADRLLEGDRDAVPWPTAAELQADGARSDEPVTAQRVPRPRRARLGPSALAIAATLAVIGVGLSLGYSSEHGSQRLETAIGEHRGVRLADGSMIFIGADSRLQIALQPGRRAIELEQGEAYFKVAKDPSRPFSVRAGAASVTALGTAFNVRRTGEHVVVGVSEGTVAVSPERESLLVRMGIEIRPRTGLAANTRLAAGQRLVVEPNALARPKIEAVLPPSVGGWRQGRLQYAGEPLSFVIADVNRYVAEPIVIADPSIANLRVTGTVSEENVMSWLASLETALPLEVVRTDDGRKVELRGRH